MHQQQRPQEGSHAPKIIMTSSTPPSTMTIVIPKHVSSSFPHYLTTAIPKDTNNDTTFVGVVYCHYAGVMWRGLFPLLMQAPSPISGHLLSLFLANSSTITVDWDPQAIISFRDSTNSEAILSNSKDKDDDDLSLESKKTTTTDETSFHRRCFVVKSRRWKKQHQQQSSTTATVTTTREKKKKIHWMIYIQPPMVVDLDHCFAAVVLRTERHLLRLQALTAWWATLGGGYFFCRRLDVSLQLARQQKLVALQIGNIEMARQCSINEAYNLIYAGKFQMARRVLTALEQQVQPEITKIPSSKAVTVNNINNYHHGDSDPARKPNDENDAVVTLRQCQAARVLAHRLKKVSKRLKRYHTNQRQEHMIDDYQRIRLVQQD